MSAAAEAGNVGGRGSVGGCLSAYRFGTGDPTTRLATGLATQLGQGLFWRASLTPDGPATVRITWNEHGIDADAWGPGRAWMLGRAEEMTGAFDPGHHFVDAHPVVLRAQRDHPGVRFGASRMLFHELVPTILAQRITAGEAIRQWHRLCRALGEPAPGPAPGQGPALLLPPSPAALIGRPPWWYHPLGIEARRAQALRTVARHADKLWAWAELPPPLAATRLALLSGVGAWTVGSVLSTALGDPDAVAVGDFHLKNIVAYALAGEPRGTDERMLELLSPYAGQRGRVVRLLLLDGPSPPKFGPRRRIVPMERW